ncbi:hypothetical protein L6452_20672 [Arctium lappa]|uniref:Uncharacterized protein n=1 Tax=Arctium lappa TaxID=4217 RepID=A0ACB9BCU8_ARCLA|nr:hypothetical protein L6452_20672 [Arctium lappa]
MVSRCMENNIIIIVDGFINEYSGEVVDVRRAVTMRRGKLEGTIDVGRSRGQRGGWESYLGFIMKDFGEVIAVLNGQLPEMERIVGDGRSLMENQTMMMIELLQPQGRKDAKAEVVGDDD